MDVQFKLEKNLALGQCATEKMSLREHLEKFLLSGSGDEKIQCEAVRIKTEPIDEDDSENSLGGEVKDQEVEAEEPQDLWSTYNASSVKVKKEGQKVSLKAEPQDSWATCDASLPKVEKEDQNVPIKEEPVDSRSTHNASSSNAEKEDQDVSVKAEPLDSCSTCNASSVKVLKEEDKECLPLKSEPGGSKNCDSRSAVVKQDFDSTPNIRPERKAKKKAQLNLREHEDEDESIEPTKKVRRLHNYSGQTRNSGGQKPAVWGHHPDFNTIHSYNGVKLKPCFVKIFPIPDEVMLKHGLEPEEKIDLDTLKKGLFSCSFCKFRTHYFHELRQHEKGHDYSRDIHKCPICDFKSNWDTGVRTHIKVFHKKETPYKCPHCDYKASYGQSLKVHLRQHNGEKPHKCKYCNYKSIASSSLRTHMLTHSGDKPYVCPHCPYRARQLPHLKSHLFMHLDLKPYACDQCDFRTRQSSHLNLHMKLVHSDERSMKCNFCDHAAKTRQALETHVRCQHTKEEPYVCNECPFRSSHQCVLRLHLKGHLQKFSRRCPYCTWSCKNQVSLDNHVNKYHPTKSANLHKCEHCNFCTLDPRRLHLHMNNYGRRPGSHFRRSRT